MAEVIVDIPELHSPPEAAQLLGIGYATVFRWIKSGKIIPIRIGGRTLIPQSEIERLKNQATVDQTKPG